MTYYLQLNEAWKLHKIPLNHRVKFIEAIQELKFEVMNQVIIKEVQDIDQGKAQILQVMKAIVAREDCINKIRQLDADELEKQREAEKTDGGKTQLYLPA